MLLASDDDSSYGMNCAMGVKILKNDTVSIEITLSENADRGGYFGIYAKRQLAQIYTFSYTASDQLNTLADSIVPKNILQEMGYDVSVRENFLPNDALNAVQAGKKLGFSAELFLFSGHGAPGSVRFTNTYVEEMLTSNTMTSNSLYQMHNTKVAVWTSCHSATDPSNGVSIAQASINCGADAAVGWTAEIGNISAKKWSDAFFDYAKQGKNVYQAAIGAARQFSMTSDTCYTSIRVHCLLCLRF